MNWRGLKCTRVGYSLSGSGFNYRGRVLIIGVWFFNAWVWFSNTKVGHLFYFRHPEYYEFPMPKFSYPLDRNLMQRSEILSCWAGRGGEGRRGTECKFFASKFMLFVMLFQVYFSPNIVCLLLVAGAIRGGCICRLGMKGLFHLKIISFYWRISFLTNK